VSDALKRITDATLGISQAAPTEVIAIRVDQVVIQELSKDPNEQTRHRVEVDQFGPLKNLHVSRLPERFKLITIGQILLRSGGSGGQRLTKADWRGRQILIQIGIDFVPPFRGQTSFSSKPDPKGFFLEETDVFMDFDQPPARYLDYTVEVRAGPSQPGRVLASTRVRLELVTLEGFLELVDQGEQVRPAGRYDCWILPEKSRVVRPMTHLEYLASVRWLWQKRPSYKEAIIRHSCIPPYDGAPGSLSERSQRLMRLRQFEELYVGPDRIDIAHVLVGIEAMRKQDPMPSIKILFLVEFGLTWSGDLGSVIAEYIWANKYKHTEQSGGTVKQFIEWYAERPDLLGDLDGVNLGATYDPSRSLSNNLRTYYAGPAAKRYSNFLANTEDASHNRPLQLEPGIAPPRFTAQARTFVAEQIVAFAQPFLVLKGREVGISLKAFRFPTDVEAIMKIDSREVLEVTDYFLDFLKDGLAAEPP
jgi:hypothetical protein